MAETDLGRWTPRRLPHDAALEGRLVRLVALDADAHASELWEAFGSGERPDVWTYMPIGPFPDEASFAAGMRWIECQRPAWVPMAILDNATGKAVGTASYMRIDAANGSAEVGCIGYGLNLKRRPAATEAMLLMARRVFEELGYRRYEWKCDADNAPSRRAAERLGFVYEGVFRQHMVVKGRNRDSDAAMAGVGEFRRVRASANDAGRDPRRALTEDGMSDETPVEVYNSACPMYDAGVRNQRRATPGRRWLGHLIALPSVRPLARIFYDWFADRLYAWNRRHGRW